MSLTNFPIFRSIIPVYIPYIFVYGFYIQINGKVSPGGGFQAGVIFASALILINQVFGDRRFSKYINNISLTLCAVSGVTIYFLTGLTSLIFDANFLDYSVLFENTKTAQKIGIFTIEIGVGITVSSVMYLIYDLFSIDSFRHE